MAANVDMEKKSSNLQTNDYPDQDVGVVSDVEIDHLAEKKLLRKIDMNLITLFGVKMIVYDTLMIFKVNFSIGTLSNELPG